MKTKTTTLDVREDIRSGRHPFARIQNALDGLVQGETLRLLAPFEPIPLFAVTASKGIRHQSQPMPEGDWEVLFSRDGAATKGADRRSSASGCGCNGTEPDEIVDVDARGLEPPQPMVKILEALARLPGTAKLRAHTDRRPVHLYLHLEDRGFIGESEERKDGSFITHIRRA